jgi:hypothetical protein
MCTTDHRVAGIADRMRPAPDRAWRNVVMGSGIPVARGDVGLRVGAVAGHEAIERRSRLPNMQAIVFGVLCATNIRTTRELADELAACPGRSGA